MFRHSGRTPTHHSVKEHEAGYRPHQVPDQTLAVAPQPVELSESIAPAIHFPGLQRDTHYPARPLLHRAAEAPGKISARGDDLAMPLRNRNKKLRTAQAVQAEAVSLVFRKTCWLEDAIGMRGG